MEVKNIGEIRQKWESDRIEYKRCATALSKDIWETISAFSNEGGGFILLGYDSKNDTPVPAGIDNPSRMLDAFTSTVGQKFNFCPMVSASIEEDEGKPLIIIEVRGAELSKTNLH